MNHNGIDTKCDVLILNIDYMLPCMPMQYNQTNKILCTVKTVYSENCGIFTENILVTITEITGHMICHPHSFYKQCVDGISNIVHMTTMTYHLYTGPWSSHMHLLQD